MDGASAATWRAFHETLGHFVYWIALLVILFGGISYFTWRDAQQKKGTHDEP